MVLPEGETETTFLPPIKLRQSVEEGRVAPDVIMNELARKTWGQLLQEHQYLQSVELVNRTPEEEEQKPVSGASYIHPVSETDSPRITLPINWRRAFNFPRTELGRPILTNISEGLSIPERRIKTNVIAVFSLAHDAGHALDAKGKSFEQFKSERDSELRGLPAVSVADFLRRYPNATPHALSDFLHAYRALPSEVNADRFAFSFMKEHPVLTR